MGRHSTYTEDLAAEICARLVCGRSLRSVCRDDDMPEAATVFKWLGTIPAFADQYARACQARADADAEEMREIADTPLVGEEITEGPDGTTIKRGDMLGHRKLQIDTRKWLAARMAPKKYGERIAHDHAGKIGLESLVAGDDSKPDE